VSLDSGIGYLTATWPRLLSDVAGPGAVALREHLARHGARPSCVGDSHRRQRLIGEVENAGLTGRGGAGFPTAKKLRTLAAGRRAPQVIANGVEGEPASDKDKVLLTRAPHLVIDGAVSAAELTGATEAVIVTHPAAYQAVRDAARERRAAGYDQVQVRVLAAADGFTAGEASAVLRWTERGAPAPTGRPPRLGSFGHQPALVQNVETLAHLALIMRHGASWFRTCGTPAEPGTMLVTMLGAVRRPGVYEVEPGIPVSGLLDLAGGPAQPPGALLIGGYFGTWVAAADALDLPFSAAGLSPLGARPGAGIVGVLPSGACGLAETARLTRYLANSSAGQCGPCVFGLDAIARELERAAADGSGDLTRVRGWLRDVTGRGACHHPDGTALMVGSALRAFRDEIGLHSRGRCSATSSAGVLPVPEQPS
jgi:NADH:ubiquinone oxidoreductase subunit F (NADH-binding)